MQSAPERHDEPACLQALRALAVLDTEPEAEFDALVEAAATVCGTPIALLSLVDEQRQWFKAGIGLAGVVQTPRALAFCAHTVLTDEILEVPDAWLDERFADNPLVTGAPEVRFYAGAPVLLKDGARIGTLCVIDHRPRRLDDAQRRVLRHLAVAAARALEGRRATQLAQLAAHGTPSPEASEMLHATLQAMGDAVIATDVDGRIVWLNVEAQRLTGWALANASGLPLADVFRKVDTASNPVVGTAFSNSAPPVAADSTRRSVLVSRDGRELPIEESAAAIDHKGGEVRVFRDRSELDRLTTELRHSATHDTLTGLINRAEFEIRLNALLQEARRNENEHALMMIDLDQFRLVNDACGHAVGDAVIQQVAGLLGGSVRASDTLARLHGDAFAVLLPGCDIDDARRIAQQICDRLDSFRFSHDDRRFRIGTSIGLVPLDQRWATSAAILQAAENACNSASEDGGNRVHAWVDLDDALHARVGAMQWAKRIGHAIDEDRFVLFAQRIHPLCADTSSGIHAEVLLRLVDDAGALVAPAAFLPAAERYNLATRIDRWVLTRTLAWLKALPDPSRIDALSVNLSGQSVGDRSFHAWAMGALAEAGPLLCRRLCLEITETAAVSHIDRAADFVNQVRAAGVRVSLDDFGAGASSFGYLKKLKIDYLKIDGQFVRTLLTDALDDAAVRCFIDVARVLGLRTVAEFVDDAAVLARLRELGVDFAQGYLLHRPAPIDELPGMAPAIGQTLVVAGGRHAQRDLLRCTASLA